jgi:hypothetical protein
MYIKSIKEESYEVTKTELIDKVARTMRVSAKKTLVGR